MDVFTASSDGTPRRRNLMCEEYRDIAPQFGMPNSFKFKLREMLYFNRLAPIAALTPQTF